MWPRGVPPTHKSIREVASGGHFPAGGQGGPANIQIYKIGGLQRPFPSRWPGEVPPGYTSMRKVASGGHFPAGGLGRARQRANLYEKWPPEAISQQVAQGGRASVQIYTKSGLRRPFPSRWPIAKHRVARHGSMAQHSIANKDG